MTPDHDELPRRLSQSLDRSLDSLDTETQQALQQIRRDALQPRRRNLHPAMMIAASLVALVLVPWLALRQPDVTTQMATQVTTPVATDESIMPADTGYLSEDPDLLADWEMLDAIGEVPDA